MDPVGRPRRRQRRRDPSLSSGQAERITIWLVSHMRARALTARALAARAGLHHSTLSRILRGEEVPTLATLDRLAAVLGDLPVGFPVAHVDSPIDAVVQALAGDTVLTAQDRRAVLHYYLAERRRPRSGNGFG